MKIHALKDSQNGFDNSGQTLGFTWTTNINYELAPDVTFQHWPIRSANWMGEFDPKTASYPKINKANIQHALDVISKIVDRYSGHPAVLGLEPGKSIDTSGIRIIMYHCQFFYSISLFFNVICLFFLLLK